MERLQDDVIAAEEGLLELEALLGKPISLSSKAKSVCKRLCPPSIWLPARPKTKQQLRPTAYLDGLRGFAAFMVYWLHHQIWSHSSHILENSFGFENQYYFACFPLIRFFFSGGHFAVALFFIISGYVLSNSPLRFIHEREMGLLASNVGSALFRRWLRLFLPVMVTTFIWMTSWHVLKIQSSNPANVAPEKTYRDDVWRWYCDFKNFSFLFHSGYMNAYNDHTWSIPLEFRGSSLVYMTMLALARCTTNMRLSCEAGLVFYFVYIVDGWYCALFMMGVLLCDLNMLAAKHRLPAIFSYLQTIPEWVNYLLLGLALYLGGVPSEFGSDFRQFRHSPGWYLLSFLTPQAMFDHRWFYRIWAATLAMIAIPRISWLKQFFESRLCQYLGRVSFAFYLVHGPVLVTLGDRIYAATGRGRMGQEQIIPSWINYFPLPSWGIYGLEINFLVSQLILLPLTLLLSEVVTRLVDEPSVKLSQWLFKQATGAQTGTAKDGLGDKKVENHSILRRLE